MSERGRLEQWKREVAARCAGNSRLVFAASSAFAGPLLGMSGMESGGFHLRGESSSGKTTALRVAASVFGPPGYMQRWRTTDNALEVIAAQYCDQLLILDELGQVDPRQAGEIAYMLANEQSKARSTRSGQARQRLTWRLLFLSAGEISLAQHMADGGKRSKAGQETRLADIPADAGCELGIFEELHGHPDGADLSRTLCKRAEELHGVVGRRWIEWLVKEYDATKQRLRELARQILAQWLPSDAGGQVHRVGGRFAIVAAAGELATGQGLTGWRSHEATEAAKRCFDAWLIDRGGAGNIEQRQMVEQVRGFIAQHGESRFTDLNGEHPMPVRDRVGFKERVKDPTSGEWIGTTYYFLLDPFRKEVSAGHDHLAVLKALKQSGFLKTTAGRPYDFNKRIPELGKVNLYRISGRILAAGDDAEDNASGGHNPHGG